MQCAAPVSYVPQLVVFPQPSSGSAQSCTRAGVALSCAAASLTPPNVNAASLDVDALRPGPSGNNAALNPSANNAACRLDKDGKVLIKHSVHH